MSSPDLAVVRPFSLANRHSGAVATTQARSALGINEEMPPAIETATLPLSPLPDWYDEAVAARRAYPALKVDLDQLPADSIALPLFEIHAQSQIRQTAQLRKTVERSYQQFEDRQKSQLELLERATNEQLGLLKHQQTAQLGGLLGKVLTAVLSGVAVKAAFTVGGTLLPFIAITHSLFTAADLAINLISKTQTQLFNVEPADTLAPTLNRLFTEVATSYSPDLTADYINPVKDLLLISTLIATNNLHTPWVNAVLMISRFAPQIFTSYTDDIEIASIEQKWAHYTAEQKINQALQQVLKEQLAQLQKEIVKTNQALAEYMTSTIEALKQHYDSLSWMARSINTGLAKTKRKR